MKHRKSFSLNFYLLAFCFCFIKEKSHDSSTIKPITYYKVSFGGGLGKGYPQSASETGIGGSLEATIQRKKKLYSVSTRSLGEIGIFDNSNVNNNISSIELMYGKVLSTNTFFCSISGGLGYAYSDEKGEFISREGGWFFGYYTFEKIKKNTIGFPISFKIFYIPTKFYGIGLDFYANINPNNTFYTASLCHQFGKLRSAVKKRKIKLW